MKLVNCCIIVILAVILPGNLYASENKPAMTPDEAMAKLVKGNIKYSSYKCVHPRHDEKRRTETAQNGQHPFATVITCSDSRVPVEILFDQGIGDIFVVRVAGNVCGTNELASCEYSVDHLQTPVLVVLGHTSCGAVTAVVTGAELHGHLPVLAEQIKPAAEKAKVKNPTLKGKELVPSAIEENIWLGVENILTKSDIIRKHVSEGNVKVIGAIYNIETGKVDWLGAHPQEAKFLKSQSGKPEDNGHTQKQEKDASGKSSNSTGNAHKGHDEIKKEETGSHQPETHSEDAHKEKANPHKSSSDHQDEVYETLKEKKFKLVHTTVLPFYPKLAEADFASNQSEETLCSICLIN